MTRKSAVITGATGQDAAYLARSLIERGYRVFGAYRPQAHVRFWRLESLGIADHPELHLLPCDIQDADACARLLDIAEPAEVYNLAAHSSVSRSFGQPVPAAQVNGIGAVHLLDAILRNNRKIRFYQAGTSEMFGRMEATPRDEDSPFQPRSPYAIAKLYAHWMTVNFREAHGLFASCGILFNHESPLRGREFVTRKIADAAARIAAGELDVLELGNLEVQRDWGYAGDYVEGMWQMLQMPHPDTFVLATGRATSVREFATLAFAAAGISIEWRGCGAEEVGLDAASGRLRVRVNPHFYRPVEIDCLIGDAAKAKRELGWAASTSLEALCKMMVKADAARLAGAATP